MNEEILDSLYKSVLKFLVPLTTKDTYQTIVDEAVKLVNGDAGIILFKKGNGFEIEYASPSAVTIGRPRGNGFVYTAFTKRKAFVLNSKDFSELYPNVLEKGMNSAVFIPLYYQNVALGVLIIQAIQDNKTFTKKELEKLKLFGSLASLVIKKMQLYDETAKALSMRNQFISLAAHELRTPLTSIHGYLQLLSKKKKPRENVKSQWIAEMYGESVKLINLINELVEVNRIETNKEVYHFQASNLITIIDKAIVRSRVAYPHHIINFEDKKDFNNLQIIADEDKIYQVLMSLIDNAAKFSPHAKKIQVSVFLKKKHIIISIKDAGRGIIKKDLPHIFEGFYKGEDNQIVGMGLGLMLTKNIIKKHRGKITIKSKPSKGTEAIVSLPLVKL